MPLRVLIVDDERPARAKLRRYLGEAPDVEVAGEASGGREAVELIGRLAPDVVFLDVQMPDLDGFGVVEALGDGPLPHVVFVTAHDGFAIRAFEVRALDYLLKPVGPERFSRVLERARAAVDSARGGAIDGRLAALLDGLRERPRYVERLLVPDGERAVFVDVAKIDRVEADRNYAMVHSGGRVFTVRATIESLHARLDPAEFIRANRSEIVRVGAVEEVQPWFHGDYRLVLRDGHTVAWTRRYVDRSSPLLLRLV